MDTHNTKPDFTIHMNEGLMGITDSENRADEVEKKKAEQLQKQKDGKGHWEEQLASDSESAVRFIHRGWE